MHHQRVGPFGLLHRGPVAGRQRGIAVHADLLVIQQIRRERVGGQGGAVGIIRRQVLAHIRFRQARARPLHSAGEPDL